MIQIKFYFCHIWPTFTSVIGLCKNSVFRTFLSSLLWYWLEIWYMNLSWHNTDQVWLLSCLTYLLCRLRSIAAHRDHFVRHLSVCPSICLSVCLSGSHTFLVVTHSYAFAGIPRNAATMFHELLPFTKILFSWRFFVMFRDIDLIFHIWIVFDVIQVKFDFCHIWPTCHENLKNLHVENTCTNQACVASVTWVSKVLDKS